MKLQTFMSGKFTSELFVHLSENLLQVLYSTGAVRKAWITL